MAAAACPFLDLVCAVRGKQHKLTRDHERQLEEVYNYFQQVLVKPEHGKQMGAAGRGSLANPFYYLPANTADWFVPRGVSRAPTNVPTCWYPVEAKDDENMCKYVALLYRLGIPTFFREKLPTTTMMRLCFSLEAIVPEVPPDETSRVVFWASLSEGILAFALEGMAEAVQHFYGKEKTSNLVAVFDASGFSPALSRWKLSLRINFVEVVVTADTARTVRARVVENLETAWSRCQEPWAMDFEPLEHQQAPHADAAPGFWDRIVDGRPFESNAQHRLVWCDVVQGDPARPEERPLVPYALLEVKYLPEVHLDPEVAGRRPPARLEMERADKQAQDMTDAQWVRMGSFWSAESRPTDFWNAPPRIVQEGLDEWTEHKTEAGSTFYYNAVLGQSEWNLPAGAKVRVTLSASQRHELSQSQPQAQPQAQGQWPQPQPQPHPQPHRQPLPHHIPQAQPHQQRLAQPRPLAAQPQPLELQPRPQRSQWDEADATPQQPERQGGQWRVYYTQDQGRAYYHNVATGDVQWELPEGAKLL